MLSKPGAYEVCRIGTVSAIFHATVAISSLHRDNPWVLMCYALLVIGGFVVGLLLGSVSLAIHRGFYHPDVAQGRSILESSELTRRGAIINRVLPIFITIPWCLIVLWNGDYLAFAMFGCYRTGCLLFENTRLRCIWHKKMAELIEKHKDSSE